jgi:hypothetical protein
VGSDSGSFSGASGAAQIDLNDYAGTISIQNRDNLFLSYLIDVSPTDSASITLGRILIEYVLDKE